MVADLPKVPAAAPTAAAAVPVASPAEELAPASVSSAVSTPATIQKMDQELLLYVKEGGKEKMRMSVWDFGGQDTFYGLHHLYMGRSCVYQDHTRCNAALGTLVLCAWSGSHSALSAQ